MGIFDKLRKKQDKPATSPKDVQAPKEEAKKDAPKKAAKSSDTKKETAKKAPAKAATLKTTKTAHTVLLEPVFTEKTFLSQGQNKIAFYIPTNANKVQVRYAVNELYGINPTKVNIVNKKGKTVKRWTSKDGKRADRKKAVITLPKGSDLSVFTS